MLTLGQDMLSRTASLIWIAALCAVLAFHCSHVICMRGERRCYHFTHIVMLIGMLYMFGSASFGFHWFPALAWIVIYAMATIAIALWMTRQLFRRRAFNGLWALALVQQGAMVYMWEPMRQWIPLLSYGLALYFGLEAFGWVVNASRPAAASVFAEWPGSGKNTFENRNPLENKSSLGDICLSVMAASMAYMFVAMQLAMSSPRPAAHLAHHAAPAQTAGISAPSASEEGGAPSAGKEEPPAPTMSEGESPRTYKIAPGDTPSRIAARLYGDAGRWREILKANPKLDPRRLRVGRAINLPAP